MTTLPWPPKELSPNGRSHHHAKAKAAKAYRQTCHWAALAAPQSLPSEGKVVLSILFHAPDKRRRDLDNMLAAIKAGLDGFADAHCVDDNRFALLIDRGEPIKGGAVVVSVLA